MQYKNKSITVQRTTFSSVEESVWNRLLSQSGFKSIFQTYQWNQTWLECFFQGEDRSVVLCCWQDDELIGILPFMRFDWAPFNGLPAFKMLKFIGAPESDYNDFLIKKEMHDEVLNACMSWLKENKKSWHIIELQDIPEDSPTSAGLDEVRGKLKLAVLCRNRATICPQIILPASYSDFEMNLSGKTRSMIRRKKKRLAHAGKAEFETGTSRDMEDFFRLYSCRWGEMSKEHQTFHRAVADALEDYLNLSFVVLDGKRIATQYCFDFNNARGLYLSGFDTDFHHLSPGVVSLTSCIQGAIEKNLSVYDFMRGDEQYKMHYSNRIYANNDYVISHSSVLLRGYAALKLAADRITDFFTFKLWRKFYPKNVYLKVRELASGK